MLCRTASPLRLLSVLLLLWRSATAADAHPSSVGDRQVLYDADAASQRRVDGAPSAELVALCGDVLARAGLPDSRTRLRLSDWFDRVVKTRPPNVDVSTFLATATAARPWRLCRQVDAVGRSFGVVQRLLQESDSMDEIVFGALLMALMARSSELIDEAAALLPALLQQTLLTPSPAVLLPLIQAIVTVVPSAALNVHVLETFHPVADQSDQHRAVWDDLQRRSPIADLMAVASRLAERRDERLAWSRMFTDGIVRYLSKEFSKFRWRRADPMWKYFPGGWYRHAFLAEFLYRAYPPEALVPAFFLRKLSATDMDLSRFSNAGEAKAVFPHLKPKLLKRFGGRIELDIMRRLTRDEAVRFLQHLTELEKRFRPLNIALPFVFSGALHHRLMLVRPDLHSIYFDGTTACDRLHVLIGQRVWFADLDPNSQLILDHIERRADLLVLWPLIQTPIAFRERIAGAHPDAYQKLIVELVASTATTLLSPSSLRHFFELFHQATHFHRSPRLWELLIDGLDPIGDEQVGVKAQALVDELDDARRDGSLAEAKFRALLARLWPRLPAEDQYGVRRRYPSLFQSFSVRSAVEVAHMDKLQSRSMCPVCWNDCFALVDEAEGTDQSLALSSLVRMQCGER